MKVKTRSITLIGILTALIIVLGLSGLGIITVPGALRITILHIPVIIAAIVAGPVEGAIVGTLFGVWSILDKIMRPTPTGFVFFNPLVSVLPRILIGLVAYYSYKYIKKILPESISISIASLLATLTNTIGVLGMIYFVYAERYMEVLGQPKELALVFLGTTAVQNGIPEAIASAILVPIIVLGITKAGVKNIK